VEYDLFPSNKGKLLNFAKGAQSGQEAITVHSPEEEVVIGL
jgi:hypothetical protein